MKTLSTAKPFWKILIKIVLVVIGLVLVFAIGVAIFKNAKIAILQAQLAPFYKTDGLPLQGELGEIVRQEPMDLQISGGTATRVLYRTQDSNGNNTFSSGMIFVPNNQGQNRPIVAWAHGTLGMGEACAPTRSQDPMQNISWVNQMLENGWIVTATDYAGLGTDGIEQYLVGAGEAHDVLNSVRAARNLSGSNAGNTFAVWGHSQGGHSSLFTGSMAKSYAPELNLAGTVASAPAAELSVMLDQQDNNVLDWVIGPEILTSWPTANDQLSADQLTTKVGDKNYQKIADQCIDDATLDGLIRNSLKQQFFATSPTDVPAWSEMAQAQTAPTLEPSQPLMVAESTTDLVIEPGATALYIQRACNAGGNLNSLWVANVQHMQIPEVIYPNVIAWINDRFNNRPNNNTCDQQLPVQPLNN
ncbi:MAG TPA: lipase family protein [Candidatus Saccharimonadales bacterium]|nr:lipase family protein [Candidatus Saccharimonadales bacterium]